MDINSPYGQVAKNSLMNWNGLTKEEATKLVEESTLEELESHVGAKNTMMTGINAIAKYSHFTVEAHGNLEDYVFGLYTPYYAELKESFIDKLNYMNKYDLVLFALAEIHNKWVLTEAYKYNQAGREVRKYQHSPIEMIGWTAVKLDLLFLDPILKGLGLEYDIEKLEEKYNNQVNDFFKNNELLTEDGEVSVKRVAKKMMMGKEFYPSLTELNTPKNIADAIEQAEQIKSKTQLIKTNIKSEM